MYGSFLPTQTLYQNLPEPPTAPTLQGPKHVEYYYLQHHLGPQHQEPVYDHLPAVQSSGVDILARQGSKCRTSSAASG